MSPWRRAARGPSEQERDHAEQSVAEIAAGRLPLNWLADVLATATVIVPVPPGPAGGLDVVPVVSL